MTFSKLAWSEVQPILQKIYISPFIKELSSGKLEQHKFVFYLQQDWMYLNEFSQALAATSLLAPNSEDSNCLLKFAYDANMVEQNLHASFFNLYNVPKEAQITPACFHYTNYLRSTVAKGNYQNALAALLPCFWVYQDVGQSILDTSEPMNPYSDWINNYASKDFSDSVDLMKRITNQSLANKDTFEIEDAIKAFKASTYFELHFWNDAYHGSIYDI